MKYRVKVSCPTYYELSIDANNQDEAVELAQSWANDAMESSDKSKVDVVGQNYPDGEYEILNISEQFSWKLY